MSGSAQSVSEPIRLDHNERLNPAPELEDILRELPVAALSRYPDIAGLEARLAAHWGVAPDCVLVGAGADESIERLCSDLLGGGGEMVAATPTFEMMELMSKAAGGGFRSVPSLRDPAPADALLGAAGEVITVISPHNPTGLEVPEEVLYRISDGLPEGALLLVDLAYVEFADNDPTLSLLERENVIVLRTFSKAWGLAGLRVGYALGPPARFAAIRGSRPPFTVATPSLWIAERALALGERITRGYIRSVRNEREGLRRALVAVGVDALPSTANFVFGVSKDVDLLDSVLLESGFRVRRFSHMPEAIRITVPGEENLFRRLIEAVNAFGKQRKTLQRG